LVLAYLSLGVPEAAAFNPVASLRSSRPPRLAAVRPSNRTEVCCLQAWSTRLRLAFELLR
jgi:hypothetical protein